MKITLNRPLCIHDIGHRSMQQDYVIPAQGEARSSDRHFMVAEGPLPEVYYHKASLTVMPYGMRICIVGKCRVFQIRPGYDEPIYVNDGEENLVINDIQHGDWFLLMTDGMCESLSIEDLVAIINRPDWTGEHKRDALLDYTSECQDNHSAYMLHIRSVEEEEDYTETQKEAPKVIEPLDSTSADKETEDHDKGVANEDQSAQREEEKTEMKHQSSKLQPVNISTDIQDGNIDLNTKSSMFDLSAKTFFVVIGIAYLLALIIGFIVGL